MADQSQSQPHTLPTARLGQTFEEVWKAVGSPAQRGLSWNGDEVHRVKTEDTWPCCKCREAQTGWLSISFHTPVCGPDCLDGLWQEYTEALSKAPGDFLDGANDHDLPHDLP